MPRASAADAAKTAETVLDAASALFADAGFAAVSLDDVARAAQVTRGAVYHHYGSKSGLFLAVAARLQEQVAGAVADVAAREDSPHAQLRAGSHAFVDAITAPRTVRILLIDAPAVIGWDEWRTLDATNSVAHLRDAVRAVGTADELVEALTAQLSGAMNEAALWIARHDTPILARQRAHAALDRLLAAVIA